MRFFGTTLSVLRSYDWILAAIVFVLLAIGFSAIYSVDLSRGGAEQLVYFPRQMVACVLGAAVFFAAGSLHATVYQSWVRIGYAAAVILLVAVLIFGSTIRGTTGWFVLGPLGSFQPAEFAKAALIIFLGATIGRMGRRFDSIQFIAATGVPVFLLAGLVLLQPDLGSAAVIVGIWIGILAATTKQKRYLASVIAFLALAGVIGWFFLFQPYQRERLLTFLDPSRDPLVSGYNINQSIIAVGSGKLFGRGLGFGSQSQLRFLPEAQTDFIFSVIAEELGFVGAAVVLLLYTLLFFRLLSIARKCPNDFSAYTVLGIAWLFFIQITLNIGATIGLLPITGVTLPFLSYGGSSLIINLFLLGVAQSMARATS
jgi:rod shape-determining protein RodA